MAGYPALRTQVKYGLRDIPYFVAKGLLIFEQRGGRAHPASETLQLLRKQTTESMGPISGNSFLLT